MSTYTKTRNILNKYDLKANKRFGQNFLIDDNILNRIVDVSNITNEDFVIEIGPGLGNLTEYLLKKAKHVLLVEIDRNMIEVINDRFKEFNNYTLVNNDILKLDIDSKIKEIENDSNQKFSGVKVVANLPYYITTPIIFKLLQDENKIQTITVMVQKEVAERMVANKGGKDYGILTLMVKFLSNANIEFTVPKEAFIPAPNVTSTIITLKKQKRYVVKNEKIYMSLVHSSFAKRRKTLINSLTSTNFNNLDKESITNILASLGIDQNIRAEQLDIEDFIKIADYIEEKMNK